MVEPPTKISGSGSGGWTPLSVEELQAVLPAYEVIEMLGAGGMGAVYKARQRSLKRLVAIKILPLGMADDEFKFVERFRNEAETLAQMNHAAIVNVYDFGETPTSTGSGQADVLLYFVMEFVDGTDLHKLIESSGTLTAEHAMSITAHVCDALAYAHRHGVVHRDIKPANILINREGHVKVADFGLAKMENPSQTSGLTRTNMTMGTPDYAAPEVFTPGMITDHRADLYAVGVMLYQMLTGQVPRGMFKLPSQKTPGTDPRFDAIIVRAMEANRDERYQSANEVRQALDEIRTTPLATNSGVGAISARSLPPHTAAKPAPPSEQKTSSSGKILAIAATVFVFGIAGFVAMNGKKKTRVKTSPAVTVATSTHTLENPSAVAGRKEIASTEKVDIPSPSGAAPSAAPTGTIDWLRSTQWARSWTLANGSLKAGSKEVTRYFGVARDATVRLRFRDDAAAAISNTAPPLQVTFRTGSNGAPGQQRSYQLQIYPARRFTHLLYLEKDTTTNAEVPVYLWKDRPIPTASSSNAEMELELRASGEELSVRAGTEQIASIRDGRAQVGGWLLIGSPGVEITGLETSGITPNPGTISSTADALPSLPNATWRDVTESVREKARAKPELVVEPDEVRHFGSGKSVDLSLMTEGMRDRAVWVRYVGDAQVSLWFKSGNASAFVLAQRHQTIFQRVEKSAFASVAMRPAIPHPAGFDANQPHELLVAVQDTAIRAWLDGRFVGEARDEEIQGSSTALVFTKFTAVQKVEIAELPAGTAALAPSKSGAPEEWDPVLTKREDFGEHASFAEFRDGAVFLRERTVYAPGEATEGAIRAKVRYTDAESTGSLTIRSAEAVRYGEESYACSAFISGKGASVVVLLRDKAAGITEPQRTAFAVSPALKDGELFLFELRAENGQIAVRVNGREAGTLADPWKGGKRRAGITPANTGQSEFRDVAVREAAAKGWTDWLGPKLANPTEFQGKGWKREPEGVSNDQEIAGRMVLPEGTKNGAIRLTYLLRDSQGVLIAFREKKADDNRDGYMADDTGTYITFTRNQAGASPIRLGKQLIPPEISPAAERTLELRFEGDQFTLTLNGTCTLSLKDGALSEGSCAVVFKRNVFVKKIEVLPLDSAR